VKISGAFLSGYSGAENEQILLAFLLCLVIFQS
jgi:hypothetical protein